MVALRLLVVLGLSAILGISSAPVSALPPPVSTADDLKDPSGKVVGWIQFGTAVTHTSIKEGGTTYFVTWTETDQPGVYTSPSGYTMTIVGTTVTITGSQFDGTYTID